MSKVLADKWTYGDNHHLQHWEHVSFRSLRLSAQPMENRITESASQYNDLELMSTAALLAGINREDKTVPFAVERALPQLELLVDATVQRLGSGGRLFYLGAGTSGRLGIVGGARSGGGHHCGGRQRHPQGGGICRGQPHAGLEGPECTRHLG
jgi:hypothetical protein